MKRYKQVEMTIRKYILDSKGQKSEDSPYLIDDFVAALDYFLDQTTDEKIGIQIQEQRNNPGRLSARGSMSMAQFADIIGMSVGQLHKFEHGQKKFAVYDVLTFADHLNCNPFVLLGATKDDAEIFCLAPHEAHEWKIYHGYIKNGRYEDLDDGRVLIRIIEPMKFSSSNALRRFHCEQMLQEIIAGDSEFFLLLLDVYRMRDKYPDAYERIKGFMKKLADVNKSQDEVIETFKSEASQINEAPN